MEIRHKHSVISFLLLAVGFCRASADLHLQNKERAFWFVFHLYQKNKQDQTIRFFTNFNIISTTI